MARARTESPAALLEHPLLTTVGLLVEAHAGMSRAMERRLADESGISLQWFEVLVRLARSPRRQLRMSDLAAQTTLSPSGLTRAVDRLEAAGLVQREACSSDRRGAYATLTAAGEARVLHALPHHVAHLVEVLEAVFTPAELATFTELSRRMRDAVTQHAGCAGDAG